MATLALTVLGRDRPGIVAAVTGAIAGIGANIEDSSMSRLRGTFAMTLVLTADVGAEAVAAAVRGPAAELQLSVEVLPVTAPEPGPAGRPFTLAVHGADRPGIVHAVTSVLATAGASITDLTTRLAGSLYVLACDVDVPESADADALAAEVSAAATRLGVTATLRAADTDEL